MECKIFDSELKILEILWEGGEASAKDVALRAAELVGWSKTTTYTVLKKLVDRGILRNENAVVASVGPREAVLRSAIWSHSSSKSQVPVDLFTA